MLFGGGRGGYLIKELSNEGLSNSPLFNYLRRGYCEIPLNTWGVTGWVFIRPGFGLADCFSAVTLVHLELENLGAECACTEPLLTMRVLFLVASSSRFLGQAQYIY